MIKPTVGRIVLFWTERPTPGAQPWPAIIAKVYDDTLVDVHVFPPRALTYPVNNVTLVQSGDLRPVAGAFVEWMPYQVGQAARTAAAEAQLAQGYTVIPEPPHDGAPLTRGPIE